MEKTVAFRIKFLLLLTFLSSAGLAAQVKISGTVTDAGEKPVSGAIVFIENHFSEADTDENGKFEIISDDLKSGDHITLMVHKKGFTDKALEINISGQAVTDLKINLGIKVAVVDEVYIDKIQIKDIQEQKPFAKSDIDVILGSPESSVLASMSYLPGVQQVGETGELSVRGGEGLETRYLFDGMLVNNMVGANIDGQAGGSRLSPSLFREMAIIQGGFSAEYGNALSSVVRMTSKDVAPSKNLNFLLSPFSLDTQMALPIKAENKQSVEVGINVMDFDLYARNIKDDLDYQSLKNGPYTLTGNLFYKNNFSDKLKFRYFSNNSFTRIDALALDIDNPAQELSSRVKNLNYFNQATLTYERNANTKFFFGINSTFNTDETLYGKNGNFLLYRKDFNITQFKTSLNKKLKKNTFINTGIEYFIENSDLINGDRSVDYLNNYAGLYTELTTKLYRNLYASIGARGEYSWLVKKANLGGRFDVKYLDNANENEVGISYGNFYQQPGIVYNSNMNDLDFSRADHSILYYRYKNNGRNFSLELYHKKYSNLLLYTSEQATYDGYGYARGLDVYFRDGKTFDRMEYRMSYSYTDAKRKYLNYPGEAPFHLNSKNKFTLSANYSLFDGNLLLGAFYNYASGRPYYNPGLGPDAFNSERTRDIHDLSSNLIYSFNVKNSVMLLIFSVSNLLENNKIYGYTYSENDPYIRREVSPMYRRFFFIGLNIAFGLNKNNDLIDQILKRK